MIRRLAECIDFMHSSRRPESLAWTAQRSSRHASDAPAAPPRRQRAVRVNPRDPALALGPDGKPARSRRAPLWADVPDEKWDDWRWQLSHRINDARRGRRRS